MNPEAGLKLASGLFFGAKQAPNPRTPQMGGWHNTCQVFVPGVAVLRPYEMQASGRTLAVGWTTSG
jgi:hypothetical protein